MKIAQEMKDSMMGMEMAKLVLEHNEWVGKVVAAVSMADLSPADQKIVKPCGPSTFSTRAKAVARIERLAELIPEEPKPATVVDGLGIERDERGFVADSDLDEVPTNEELRKWGNEDETALGVRDPLPSPTPTEELTIPAVMDGPAVKVVQTDGSTHPAPETFVPPPTLAEASAALEQTMAKTDALLNDKSEAPKPEDKPTEAPKEKRQTVVALAEALLRRKDDKGVGLPYEAIIAEVKRQIPGAKTTTACLRWYATRIRETGERLPERPQPAKKPAKAPEAKQ